MKTVIEMAREAGLFTHKEVQPELQAFAELVRADAIADEREKWEGQTAVEIHEAVLDEREACAKVCEEPTEQTYEVTTSLDGFESTRQMRMPKSDRDCAAAIRARSNT